MAPSSPTAAISSTKGKTVDGHSQNYKESTVATSGSTKGETSKSQNNTKGEPVEEFSKEIRGAIMVIAILATTMTYEAILIPPGGYWQDDLQNHTAGNPIMATKHPRLYGMFVAVNASAFVISFAVMAFLFVPSLFTLGRLEHFVLQIFRKWILNFLSNWTQEDKHQNLPKRRNMSSNSTAVVDEHVHLLQYVFWVYLCLLLALALWVFQHLRGQGLVVFFIAYPSILVTAWASIFFPRLYRMWKKEKENEKQSNIIGPNLC